MIPLFGSEKRLCDGFSRRDLLHIGGLGAFGLTVDMFGRLSTSQAAAVSAVPHFGQAKSCILLFLFGSPAQHETFDPKPEAPAEVRGEMQPSATVVSGVQICEGLPRTATVIDRITLVRSMAHPYPLHGVAYALTGMPTYSAEIEDRPRDPAHWPFIGSIVDYLEAQRTAGELPDIPRNIGLPWLFGSRSTDKPPLSGPYAAFLGRAYDPIWTAYDGKPTRVVPKLSPSQSYDVRDHFAGVESDGRFGMAAERQTDISAERFASRRSLLDQFDGMRNWLEKGRDVETYARQRQAAYSLLSSPRIREALDIGREPDALREEYGMTMFGQAALAARRLVEAGSKFVSVFWDPVGP